MTLFSLLLRLQIIPRFTVFISNFKHKLTHVLVSNPSNVACQNTTRHMIWRHTLFCFTAQAWNAFRTELLHCFILTSTTHFPASLQVSSVTREANRAMFATFFNCCRFFLREKWNEYSHIHKCKMNMCFPPMIQCRFVHSNYAQKSEARVLVIQVVDAKAHYLLHGSLRHETTSNGKTLLPSK